MCNFVVATTKLQLQQQQQQKDFVMYYSTENVGRLIFLLLFLLCLMYDFVSVATTQLHSNNNKKINLHKWLNFQ